METQEKPVWRPKNVIPPWVPRKKRPLPPILLTESEILNPDVTFRSFAVDKDNLPGSGQDAFAANPAELRFAIADGVSRSFRPRMWAELMVEKYVEEPLPRTEQEIIQWFEPIQRQWGETTSKTMRHWAEKRLGIEAFTTFVGLKITQLPTDNKKGSFEVEAIGDSDLLQLRPTNSGRSKADKYELILGFPISDSDGFNPSGKTFGFGSLQTPATGVKHLTRHGGEFLKGDVFILATDAVAEWLLKEQESGVPAWNILLNIPDNDAFVKLIEDHRRRGKIKDDDSTVGIIEV